MEKFSLNQWLFVKTLTPNSFCSLIQLSLFTSFFLLLLGFFFGGDLVYNCLDLGLLEQFGFVGGSDHAKLDRLFALDHFQQGFTSQAHSLRFIHIIAIILLQKLSQLFGFLAHCRCFPLAKSARGLCLEEHGLVSFEANQKVGDSEGSHTAPLRILLLGLGHKAGHIFD